MSWETVLNWLELAGVVWIIVGLVWGLHIFLTEDTFPIGPFVIPIMILSWPYFAITELQHRRYRRQVWSKRKK